MNHIYRLVFRSSGFVQVASENSMGRGKSRGRKVMAAFLAGSLLASPVLSFATTISLTSNTGKAGTAGSGAMQQTAGQGGSGGSAVDNGGAGGAVGAGGSAGGAGGDGYGAGGAGGAGGAQVAGGTSGAGGGGGGGGAPGYQLDAGNDYSVSTGTTIDGGSGGSGGFGGNVGTLGANGFGSTVAGSGSGGNGGDAGNGGDGIYGNDFSLTNAGSIVGGDGGSNDNFSTEANGYASIGDASGGYFVAELPEESGTYTDRGGNGGNAGNGGDGIQGEGFALVNDGNIQGGDGGFNANLPSSFSTKLSQAGGSGGSVISATIYSTKENLYAFGGNAGNAGNGGDGIEGSSFQVTNDGTIAGGNGGGNIGIENAADQNYVIGAGSGGFGLLASSAGSISAVGGNAGNAGDGGDGIQGKNFELLNDGTVTGGNGGDNSGSATNDYAISVGNGSGGMAIAQGNVSDSAVGGNAGNAGNGGDGVQGSDFQITNDGMIAGGNGGSNLDTVLNLGTYGYSSGNGSGGIALAAGGSASNALSSFGGTGGSAGNGGDGVQGSDFRLINSGTIAGGDGGTYGGGSNVEDLNNGVEISVPSGNGGAGVSSYAQEGKITTTSLTSGANGEDGRGGVGIVSTGDSTVIEEGTSTKLAIIEGGSAGGRPATDYADAIQFSGGGNTLEIDNPDYEILGNVISTSGTGSSAENGGDTLELAGNSVGAVNGIFSDSATTDTPYLPGIGPVYSGFNTLVKTGLGVWQISGTATAIPNWVIDQGILSINGNYDPSASSTLSIAITPDYKHPGSGYGQLVVNGSAQLRGTLKILDMEQLVTGAPGGTYGNSEYQLIRTENGVSGSFSNIIYDPAFAPYITPVVKSSGNNEVLLLTAATAPKAQPEPEFSTGNVTPANLYVVNQDLHSTLQTVLDGSQGIRTAGSMRFTSTHAGPWAKVFGGFGRSNGYSLHDYGGIAGYGASVGRHLVLGGAVSGSATDTQNATQSASGQAVELYGYGIYTQGHLRVSGDLGVGDLSLNTHRYLLPTNLQAIGSTDGWFLGIGTQLQYLIPMGSSFLLPYGSLTYLHTEYGAFTDEDAGILDLTSSGIHSNVGSLTAGIRYGIDLHAQGLHWIPWAEIGGTANVGSLHSNVLQTVGLAGNNTHIARMLIAPGGALDVGAGLAINDSGPWSIKAAYHGQFLGGDAHYNAFSLLANYRW